jgi:dynein heavy chain, axonemal
MDEISNYIFKECKPMLPVREEGLFISLLNLLHAMLSENPNISSEVHIERIYLYCLIWTFGGVLQATDQKGFNDLLNNLTSALPDDDLKSSIFAYYVDESGEWDLWSARVQDIVYLDTVDLLGNVFVDTIDTIRCRIFMEFAYTAGSNCLIFGEAGCGKTRSVEDFMQDFGKYLVLLVFFPLINLL